MKNPLALMSILAMSAVMANAQVIISDTFTGAGDGVFLTGRTPETSLPGSNWMKPTSQNAGATSTTAGYGNPTPGALAESQGASAVSIASAGGYTKPTSFTISADLSIKNQTGGASNGRGVALGFFSSTANGTGDYSQNLFTGLLLDDSGNLARVNDPNNTGFFGAGSTISAPIAFVGTFNTNSFYNLSYTVNTATGAISNISLAGSAADYSALGATSLFTNAATTYAGYYGSSTTYGSNGAVDNFVVAVPEPSTWAMLLGGLGMLMMFRRRRA